MKQEVPWHSFVLSNSERSVPQELSNSKGT